MLTIHAAQMQAFSRESEEDFKDRAVAHVLARTRRGTRAEDLRGMVEEGLAAARANGFVTEAQAVAFIELWAARGPGFLARGRAAAILASEGTPDQRLRALQEMDHA